MTEETMLQEIAKVNNCEYLRHNWIDCCTHCHWQLCLVAPLEKKKKVWDINHHCFFNLINHYCFRSIRQKHFFASHTHKIFNADNGLANIAFEEGGKFLPGSLNIMYFVDFYWKTLFAVIFFSNHLKPDRYYLGSFVQVTRINRI